MSTAIVIPWRQTPDREPLFEWVTAKYRDAFPGVDIVVGSCNPDLPFNRSEAILDGARSTPADVLIVSDGDVFCDGLPDALEHVEDSGWAVPHLFLHRLSQASTERVLAGEDWRGLPLSKDNAQDSRPYKGNEAGTLLVIRRDLLFDVCPDVRFVGWSREDQAWAKALTVLHGKAWRGSADCVHLWHEPQPRPSRVKGSPETEALFRRYKQARHPQLMRKLVDEAKEAAHELRRAALDVASVPD